MDRIRDAVEVIAVSDLASIAPPVTEAGLTLQFPEVFGLTAADIVDLRGMLPGDFPGIQHAPPLPPMMIGASGEARGAPIGPTIMLTSDAQLLPRTWFVSPDGSNVVQFQPDRLSHNWRRIDPSIAGAAAYPGFDALAAHFQAEVVVLGEWLRSKGLVARFSMGELLYQNRFLLVSDAGEIVRLSSILRFYTPTRKRMIRSIQFRWAEALDAPRNGTIETGISNARSPDGRPAIVVQYVGRVSIDTEDVNEALHELRALHDDISVLFEETISPEFRLGGSG